MVCETRLESANLIWPIFVIEGEKQNGIDRHHAGVQRMSVDLAAQAAKEAADLGIAAVAIFPVTPLSKKSENGRHATDPNNLICQATRAIASRLRGVWGLYATSLSIRTRLTDKTAWSSMATSSTMRPSRSLRTSGQSGASRLHADRSFGHDGWSIGLIRDALDANGFRT